MIKRVMCTKRGYVALEDIYPGDTIVITRTKVKVKV